VPGGRRVRELEVGDFAAGRHEEEKHLPLKAAQQQEPEQLQR
jgi:hypothetical protein